jgi:hypothetical protein
VIVINTIDKVLVYLLEGFFIIRTTIKASALPKEVFVAGRMIGYTDQDWIYILQHPINPRKYGIVHKTLFNDLFKNYYIKKDPKYNNQNRRRYLLNDRYQTGETSLYQHKIDGWQEMISRPVIMNHL